MAPQSCLSVASRLDYIGSLPVQVYNTNNPKNYFTYYKYKFILTESQGAQIP